MPIVTDTRETSGVSPGPGFRIGYLPAVFAGFPCIYQLRVSPYKWQSEVER